jgi:cytoskeletal protein CcmA (bactofilin family)
MSWNQNVSAERATIPERRPFASSAEADQVDEAEAPKASVLGKTLFFKGELTAEEDLILQGRVEGSIRHARSLTIGGEGSVLGDVYASHLIVEGSVQGDLHASEAVIVRATAQVQGNIIAPRVGIMEGATFNGRVEMNSGVAAARPAQTGAPAMAARASGASAPAASAQSGGGAAPSATGRGVTPATSSAAPSRQPAAAKPAAAPTVSTPTTPLGDSAVDQMLSNK